MAVERLKILDTPQTDEVYMEVYEQPVSYIFLSRVLSFISQAHRLQGIVPSQGEYLEP